MLWLIFAMLLVLGVVGFLAPYTLLGGVIQILLISRSGGARHQSYSGGIESNSAVSSGLVISA